MWFIGEFPIHSAMFSSTGTMPGRASVSANLGKAVLRGVRFGRVWFAEEKCRGSNSPRWVVYEFYFLLRIGS